MRFKLTVTAFSLALPFAATAAHAQETAAEAQAESPTPAPAATAPAAEVVAPVPAPATVAPPAPPAAAPPPAVALAWEALVDTYFLYNFTGDPKNQGPSLRQFDNTANNFALNYAKLGVSAGTDRVGFRVDIGGGHAAAIINGASTAYSATASPGAPTDTASLYGNAFLVQQAFATLKALPYLTIDAGKFVTAAGAEVIESNRNWLYSRSLLFYGIPLLHTGLRVNLLPTPELTIALHVINGWNNDPDTNNYKTFGAAVLYVPANLGLTAGVTAHIGKEGGIDPDETRMLFDAVVLKDLGNLSLGLNVDYLKLGDAYWAGASAMGRYLLGDSFNVAARAEYLKSKNGAYLPVDGSVYEFTGMGGFTVDKHYELRLELRADLSDQEIFVKGSTPRKNQVTGLLAALAYF